MRLGPNSEHNVVQIFSKQGAVKYAFWILDVLTSRSSNAEIVRAMWKLSRETTLTYFNVGGATFVWPLAKYQASRRKSSILITKII